MFNTSFFHAAVPPRAMGRYTHFVLLRETDSYSLFQTDGELNTARVRAGKADQNLITRLMMFKRKQTTPERLVGRELLRRYGLVSAEQSVSDSKKADERGVLMGYRSAITTSISANSAQTASATGLQLAMLARRSRRCTATRPTASRHTKPATKPLHLMRHTRAAR